VYRLEISQSSHRQVRKLLSETRERINQAIARLAEETGPSRAKKLAGREGYRIRVGDYRIRYQIDDGAKVVVIYQVMARGDVYRFR